MAGESDEDLPLHDEARARSEWRGDETPSGKSGPETSWADSEIDPAGHGEASLPTDFPQRPPD